MDDRQKIFKCFDSQSIFHKKMAEDDVTTALKLKPVSATDLNSPEFKIVFVCGDMN